MLSTQLLLAVLLLLKLTGRIQSGLANENTMLPLTKLPEPFVFRRFALPTDCGQNQFERRNTARRGDHIPHRSQVSHSHDHLALYRGTAGRRGGHRIADGFETQRVEFPSAVQIYSYKRRKVAHCTGTIIHPSIVITAAHCLRNKTDLWIVASQRFLASPGSDPNSVVEPRLKADYVCTPPGILDDVAMIVLQEPLELKGVQQAACVDDSTIPVGAAAISVGYGFTSEVPTKVFASSQKALKVERSNDCVLSGDVSSLCFATLAAAPRGSWCGGDSGGPVFRVKGGRHYLSGIILGRQKVVSSCEQREPKMRGLSKNVPYYYLNYMQKWLRADAAAYNTECFKAPYTQARPF